MGAVAELPPPSPEYSQAKTLEAVRNGTLGGLVHRSEGKHLKPAERFTLTLAVAEPSVLAFRWSSVTDGALHFAASFVAEGAKEATSLAPLGPRPNHRSGALDVGAGTVTVSWDNRSSLFARAVSYCLMLCPNSALCHEQQAQAVANARDQTAAFCGSLVGQVVDVAAQVGGLRREAAAAATMAEVQRVASSLERDEAEAFHVEIEELLARVDAARALAKARLASAAARVADAEEHEQRAESLRGTAAQVLAAASTAAAVGGGADAFDVDDLATQRAEHRSVHQRSLEMD